MSFVLLVGAGLLVRTLWNLHAVDPGYELESVLSIETPSAGDFGSDVDARSRAAAVDRSRRDPERGVGGPVSVGATRPVRALPGADAGRGRRDGPAVDRARDLGHDQPRLLRHAGNRLGGGPGLRDGDDRGSTPVAIINESAAKYYFPDGGGLGKKIGYSFGGFGASEATLVGVVADSRITSVDTTGQHVLYIRRSRASEAGRRSWCARRATPPRTLRRCSTRFELSIPSGRSST